MKLEWKPALILLTTFALGMALGLVVRGAVSRERERRVAELRTEPGFVSLVESVIQPRPAQEDSIRPILAGAARRYDSLVTSARSGLDLVLDSMKLALEPYLDSEQRIRLSRMATLPDPNRRPGPPRDDRPPESRPPREDRPRDAAPPPPRDDRPRDTAPPPPDDRPPDAPPPRPR